DSGASSAPSSIHDAKRDEGICIRRVCGRAALHAWKSSGRNDSLRESFCTHNVNDEQAARLKPCPPNQSEILALHQLRAQFMTRSGMKGFVSGASADAPQFTRGRVLGGMIRCANHSALTM